MKHLYKTRILELLEERNLKLRDIDKILNFNPDTFSQFASEKTILPVKHLNTLCNYFGASFDYIFEFSDNRNYINSNNDIILALSGERLKNIRKEIKIPQYKLAQELNIVNTMLCEYEKGHFIISTHALYTICKKYNISADYLLGKTDEPKYLK